MTTVVICKDKDGLYKGFYCMGHALFAEEGEPDILCAAVSALTIATINGLEELAGETFESVTNEETGFKIAAFCNPVISLSALFAICFLL